VRNRAVHILDYKPDARTNRPIAQLTVYALALTKLVPGLKLFEYQMCLVQRGGVLRIFSAYVAGAAPRSGRCATKPAAPWMYTAVKPTIW
jgi:hypothetical protein